MIEFADLLDDHPDLDHSPLLRATRLTLEHAVTEGRIGLTKTKAFKRSFVHWVGERFEWPGSSLEEMLRYRKALNEYDFPPLEIVHFLLLQLKLGRRVKQEFKATRKGADLARRPGSLFAELAPFFLLNVDHSSYGRFEEAPFGTWEVWLNVMNVELEDGASEGELFGAFYGEGADWDNDGWQHVAAFSQCVLKPLEWTGLISIHEARDAGRRAHICFKTPLWRSALKLETDDKLVVATRH